MRKMKRRMFSAALALCVCISSESAAYAYQEVPSSQGDILTEDSKGETNTSEAEEKPTEEPDTSDDVNIIGGEESPKEPGSDDTADTGSDEISPEEPDASGDAGAADDTASAEEPDTSDDTGAADDTASAEEPDASDHTGAADDEAPAEEPDTSNDAGTADDTASAEEPDTSDDTDAADDTTSAEEPDINDDAGNADEQDPADNETSAEEPDTNDDADTADDEKTADEQGPVDEENNTAKTDNEESGDQQASAIEDETVLEDADELEDQPTATVKVWSDAADPEDVEVSLDELERLESSAGNSISLAAARTTYPSYTDAYNTMAGLQSQYPEGMGWTNFTPYGSGEGAIAPYYTYKGGTVNGARLGVGCAAFVFLLSDAVFGDIPAATYSSFTYDDVKVSDILRVDNSHFVIVLQKSAGGVVVAEANYNKSVHWGRTMSRAEVEAANFIVSRYPKDFTPPDAGDADEAEQSGKTGNLSWTLTKGKTLTISGSGEMPAYSINEADQNPPWYAYKDNIHTIIIEDGVTSISDFAFYGCSALDVFIPAGVTSIGQSAFYSAKLVSVTIPNTVISIGNDAFRECTSLKSASVSEGLKTIGERAFRSCGLEYIDFPASVTSIGAGAFSDCTNIYQVRFAPGTAGVTIGDDVFSNCQRLTYVTLPQTLTKISPGMFASTKLLFSLHIPKNVKQVGEIAKNSPFTSSSIQEIYFEGTEDEWKSAVGNNAALIATLPKTILFNQEFNNPFAPIDGDPGDLITDPCKDGHKGEEDAEGKCSLCGQFIHHHSWAEAWTSNETHHWHECSNTNVACTVTEDAKKDGYAEHTYGEWVVDTEATAAKNGSKHQECTVCGYKQTEEIPATGETTNPGNQGSGNGSSSSGNGSSSSGNGSSSSGNGSSSSGNGSSSSGSGSSWSPGSSGSSWSPGSSVNTGTYTGSEPAETAPIDSDDSEDSDDSGNESEQPNDTDYAESIETTEPGTPDEAPVPDETTAPDNSDNNKISPTVSNNFKKQLKTEMKIQLKADIKTELKKELKTELKKNIGKITKKQLHSQLKAKLKKSIKAKIKLETKAAQKANLKKQFGTKLGDQFSDLFNQQFNKQFSIQYNTLFNQQYNELFSKLYKQLKK